MELYDEDIFEVVAEIVASTMEENEISIDAEGGKKVAEYFRAIYDGIANPPVKPAARPGKFEVYKDGKGEYRFRLKAGNGEVVATSEGYSKKASCLKGIESVRGNAVAPVVEVEE